VFHNEHLTKFEESIKIFQQVQNQLIEQFPYLDRLKVKCYLV